jgi:hypothetical protein
MGRKLAPMCQSLDALSLRSGWSASGSLGTNADYRCGQIGRRVADRRRVADEIITVARTCGEAIFCGLELPVLTFLV